MPQGNKDPVGLACLIFKRKSWHAYFSNQEEYTYLCIYRFLFEVFQFLNVGNTSLFLKKNTVGAKSNMASGDHSAPSAEPSLFAWPSASSMQKGITENSAQGPQSRESPLGHFRAGNLGIVVPFDLYDQGPLVPHFRGSPPTVPLPMKKRRVCWAKGSACPELTSLLLDQPLTPGDPRSPYIRGPEPVCQTNVSVFRCCKKKPHGLKQQPSHCHYLSGRWGWQGQCSGQPSGLSCRPVGGGQG